MEKTLGAILREVDLHVHTPASTDYDQPTASPDDIIDAAISAKLDAIAITDHNTVGWVERVRAANKGGKLVIFPGFELNANGGHILALFDPAAPLATIETALIECGIPKPKWGEEAYVGVAVSMALDRIVRNGGLAVAAHAEKPKGFFGAIQQGAARQAVYDDKNLAAVEASSVPNLQKAVKSAGKGFGRRVAIIQGSDAHSPDKMGSRRIRIRLDHLSIEGLRQAFVDPDVRILLLSAQPASPFPYIESLTVDRGFLGGQTIEFNTGLNCLVGGTGTGKSTVIEFLRFALDQLSNIETIQDDCLGKLTDLAGAGTAFHVVVGSTAKERFQITRVFDGNGDPITVTRLSDQRQVNVSEMRRFFPVHAFSQGEVVNICRSPLAQLELVDRHLDIGAFVSEIEKARKVLDKQSSQIAKLDVVVANKKHVLGELQDTKIKIDTLSTELRGLKESKKNKAVTSHPLWMEEESYWQGVGEAVLATRAGITDAFDEMHIELLDQTVPDEQTPNKALLDRNQTVVSKLESAKERAKQLMLTKLDEVQGMIEANRQAWNDKFAKHKSEYGKTKTDSKTQRLALVSAEIGEARKRSQGLRSQLVSISETEKRLKLLFKERERLLRVVSDSQDRIRALRQRKAKEIVKLLSGRLSLEYITNGDRDTFKKQLTQVLKGTYAQKQVVEAVSAAMLPARLIELVKAGDAKAVSSTCDLDEKWANTVVQRLTDDLESMYRIESTLVEDRLVISLRVTDGEYRPLEKLSTGQKATVVILLTMISGNLPIIFDQPEDALYAPFIYSDIVKNLRDSKDKRQFILATHNANIAIGSDVDLGIVLDGTASKTAITSSGGLDDDKTRGLLLLHLEGGEKAFMTRHVKFGIK
jgi:DNA repair ATPase RecN